MASRDIVHQRGRWILDEVLRTGSVKVEQICSQFGVSVATARRDLEALEEQGRLRRNHGGAVAVEPLLYEPFRQVSSYSEQLEKYADEKRRIAQAASELIRDGDTVGLTSGTTTTEITRSVSPDKKITLVTNAVNVAMELYNRPNVEIFVPGGFLHGAWFSLVGPPAVQAMSRIFLDKAFIGVNGVHPEHGATVDLPYEAAFNSAMAAQARQKIVVADHSKLGILTTYQICPAKEIHLLITDSGASEELVSGFTAKGIEVRRV